MTAADLAAVAFGAIIAAAHYAGRYNPLAPAARVRHSLNRGWR